MKIWKGFIHQVPSGTLDFGHLKRDMYSFDTVFEQLATREHEYYNKLWRASMIARNPSWIYAAIGKASMDQDEDDWGPERGWILSADRSKHACRLLVHKPTKTLFIEYNNKVSKSPITITTRLEKLLNDTLSFVDPDVGWVFRLGVELDTREFNERFDSFEQVYEMEIHVSIPNANLDEPLRELLGIAGDAGAEDVGLDIKSTKGIDRESHFVVRARQLLDGFLALIRAKGRYRNGQIATIDSRTLAKPIEHTVKMQPEEFGLDNANVILSEVGPIHESSELSDDDGIVKPYDEFDSGPTVGA